MSTYGTAYVTASKRSSNNITSVSTMRLGRNLPIQTTQPKIMKLTIKERFRNWLMRDDDQCELVYAQDDDGPDIQSQAFRLNVYGASGGTIVETTKYDRKNDDNRHSLYVITEDKDLGEELSKIITMEQLR